MLYFAMKIFLILLLQCILQAKSCGESQFEINQPPLMPQAKNLIENFDILQCNTIIHGHVVVRPIDERDAAPSPRRKRQAKKTKLSKQALNKIYFERRLKKFSVKSQIRKSLSRRGFFTAGTTRNVMRRYVRGKGRIVMSAKGKLAKKNLPRHFKKSQDVACDLGIFKKEGDEERFLKAKLNPRQPAGRKKEQYDENRPMNPAQQKRKEYDQYSAKNRQNNRGQDQRGGNERPKNPRKEKRKEYEQRSASNRQKDAKPQIRKPYDQPQGNRFERPYDKQGTTCKLFQATLDLDEEINRLVTAKRGGKREEKSGRKEFGFRKDDNKLRDRERTTWYLTKKRHGRFRTMANIPSDEDRSAMVKFIPSTRGPYTTGKKTYSFLQEVEGERENQEQREREYKWMMYEAHEATRFGFVTKRKKKTTPLPAPKKVHSDEYMYEYKDESGCVVENYKPKTSPKGVQQNTEKPTPLSIESGDHQEEKKNRKSDKDSAYDDVYSSDEGSQSSYNEFSYDHKKSLSHSSSEDNKYSYDESHSSGKSADDDEYSSYESYDKSGKKKTSRSSDDKKTTHHKSTKPSKTTGLNDESVSSDSLDSVDHEYSYKDFQSLLNESSISEDKRSTMTTLRYRDIEKLIHSDEEGDNNSDSNDNPISKIDTNEKLNKRAKKLDKNEKTSGKKKSKKSDNDETYSSNDENSRTEDESVDQAGAYDSDSDGEYPVYETSEEERTKRTFSDVSSGSSIDESDRHENEPLSSSDFYESDEYYKSDDSKDDRLEYDNSLHESSYDFAETKEKKRSRKKTTAKDIDHLDHSLENEEELTTTRKKILTSHLPLTTRSALSSHKLSSHQSKISSLSSHIAESTLTSVTKKPRSSRRSSRRTVSAGNSVYTMVCTNQSSVTSKATREKPSTIQLSQNLNISPGAELTRDSLNITKKTRKPYTRKPKTTPISLQPQR